MQCSDQGHFIAFDRWLNLEHVAEMINMRAALKAQSTSGIPKLYCSPLTYNVLWQQHRGEDELEKLPLVFGTYG